MTDVTAYSISDMGVGDCAVLATHYAALPEASRHLMTSSGGRKAAGAIRSG